MRFVEKAFSMFLSFIVIVTVGYILYRMLLNGAYWGGVLGDVVSGAIDLATNFANHLTA